MYPSIIDPPGRLGGAALGATILLLGALPDRVRAEVGPRAAAGPGLEEVVVTARRREERLQDTPISITAFTAAEIESRAESNIGELAGFVPNLTYTIGGANGGSATQLLIRGIGQIDFAIGKEPGVALYVDGVYLSRSVGALLDVADLERIEVLRGPQGTLFGRNAVGGALNVTTVKPGKELSGEVRATVGRFDHLEARGLLNAPLGENLFLRLTAGREVRDGIGRRLTDGAAIGDVDRSAARAQLRWVANESIEVNLAADYTRRDEGTYPAVLLAVANPPAGLQGLFNNTVGAATGRPLTPALITGDRYDSFTAGPNINDQTIWGAVTTIDASFGGLELKSITGYRDLAARFSRETDGHPLPYLDVVNDDEQQQFSQELQLTGSRGRLEWIAGAYYFDEDSGGVSDARIGSGVFSFLQGLPRPLIPLAAPPPGTSCAAGTTPPGFPCAGGFGNPLNVALDNDRTDLIHQDTRSTALFGEARFAFGGRTTLTLGGRFTDEDKTFSLDSTRTGSGVKLLPFTRVEDSWTNFSPKVGVDVRWRDGIMTYLTATDGFKAGGFNARARNGRELEPFDPEEVRAYEIGAKTSWLDNRLRVNAAVFFNDYTDIQVIVVQADSLTGQIFSRVENAGEAETKGFEVELLGQISAGLELSAGLGYTDAEFTRVQPGGEFSESSKFIQTPEWTANVALQYRRPLGGRGSLVMRSDYGYRSEFFNDARNSPLIREDGYGLLNASLGFESAGGSYGVRVFATNLTDEKYLLFGIDGMSGLGFASGTYGRPREWGLTAFYRF